MAPGNGCSCDVASASAGPRSQPALQPPDPTHQPVEVDFDNQLDVKLTLDGVTLREATLASSPMLPYLAMVASLIEGRVIGCEELLQALLRSMRQRSFDIQHYVVVASHPTCCATAAPWH
jgi:hypothetical protein